MGDAKKKPLPIGLVLADTGEGGEIVVEVFENERFFPTYGWLPPSSFISSDRAHFSSENGEHGIAVSRLEELDKPDIGEGVLEWLDHQWKLDKSFDVGCDKFGWSYALEWYFLSRGHIEERDLSNSDHCFVRRRRWLRRLRRVSPTELKDREARLASSSGAEVTLILKGKEGHKLGVSLRYHEVACSVYLHKWIDDDEDSVLKQAIADFKRHHSSAIYQPSLGDIVVEVNGVNLIGHPFKRCVEMVRDACADGLHSVRLRKKPDKFSNIVSEHTSEHLLQNKIEEEIITEPPNAQYEQPETSVASSFSDWMARRTGSGVQPFLNPILVAEDQSEENTASLETDLGFIIDDPDTHIGDIIEDHIPVEAPVGKESVSDGDELVEPDPVEVEAVETETSSSELATLPSGLISSNITNMQFSSLTELVMTALGPPLPVEEHKEKNTLINLASNFEECPSSDDETWSLRDSIEEEEKSRTNLPKSEPLDLPSSRTNLPKSEPLDLPSKAHQGFFDILQRATPFTSSSTVPSTPARPPTPPLPDEELKAVMLLNHQPLVMRSKNSTRSVRFAEELEEVKYIERITYVSSEEEVEEDDELEEEKVEEKGGGNSDDRHSKVKFQFEPQTEPRGLALVSGRQSEFV